MSRIGENPINIPEGVDVSFVDSIITVKGSKGELTQDIKDCIKINIKDNIISLERESDQKDHRSLHGLYRALIANMIEGVNSGFTKQLELIGVGYRAASQGQKLDISVGYSHNIIFEIPDEVKVTCESEKGKAPIITLNSHDKQLIGAVAAKIRSFRKPEPYKGKGIKFVGEHINRKAGKTAAAGA
jgi:large subunit ribosomal protein L6|tara:strand:- start:6053 stop:6610 length:558 start_codon:yes stop_codon:yes gene_type:complete